MTPDTWADAVVGKALARLTPAEAEDWQHTYSGLLAAICAEETSPLHDLRVSPAALHLADELRRHPRIVH